ncbi:hypothetical protein H6G80_32990 [Nostoc sp. FACHB-87]|uniref:hypothetical protein n=1 Tax=Nostocaceae TaxID=1162 RepID=UPI001684EDB1|nr:MULTISPECIES: hypothetical protein [Nostocaceae]MBD2458858.1 hypothetical protein [Nostoc sp. FACHB-87]MBD2479901.1 hypothetical protein [Anabaena sp. FACHB-83]
MDIIAKMEEEDGRKFNLILLRYQLFPNLWNFLLALRSLSALGIAIGETFILHTER